MPHGGQLQQPADVGARVRLAPCYGKTGGSPYPILNIITVRGRTAGRWPYRPWPQTYTVTLTNCGVLSLTVDLHNGLGPIPFIAPTNIVGLNGQPAVPAKVFASFARRLFVRWKVMISSRTRARLELGRGPAELTA